jgi:hypothetical protein
MAISRRNFTKEKANRSSLIQRFSVAGVAIEELTGAAGPD